MATTLVAEVTWETYGDKLQALIDDEPTGTPLLLLKDYLAMGAQRGDRWIGREFVDPPGVELEAAYGALYYAKSLWDSNQRRAGVKAVKTGQLAETYVDPGLYAKEAQEAALAAAYSSWWPYKKDKTRAGKL